MKRLLFLFAIFCTILTSCRAQNPFQAIADMDDVQTVYVGKAVMKLAKGIDLGDQALNKMTGNLDSVLVMNISNKKAAQKAREMVKEYVEQNGLEQLLAATEKDESTTISDAPPTTARISATCSSTPPNPARATSSS